jgi:arylsulfatase A-like enzyme
MKKKPNILCFVTDDQPREWFNCTSKGKDAQGRGLSLTPTLDSLAERSVVFDNLYTPSPLCVPSRFAYLTGCYPSRAKNDWFTDLHRLHNHTFVHQEAKITPDLPTIAQRMQEQGYKTGAVGKNHAIEVKGWKMLSLSDDPHDPDIAQEIDSNRHKVKEAYYAAGFDYVESIYHTNPSVHPKAIGVHNMEWLVEGACKIIDNCKEEPFFLYLASTLPHGPREGWKHDPLATPDGHLSEPPETTMPPRQTIPERLQAAGYDEESNRGDLLWLDDGLKAVLDKLEANGQLENTLIYFGTDHGIDAKASVYEPGVHITGMFTGPGVDCARTSEALCTLPDIPVTLLDFAGGDSSGMDGHSLRPVLTGETEQVHDSIYLEFGHTRTIIKDGWKYVALRYSDYTRKMDLDTRKAWLESAEAYLRRCNEPFTFKNNDPEAAFGQSGYIPDGWSHERIAMNNYPHYYDPDQLYDLEEDPGERQNLANDPAHAARLEEMKKLLCNHLENKAGGFAEFKTTTSYPDLNAAERAKIGDQLMQVVFH